jgi:hypothetical protein
MFTSLEAVIEFLVLLEGDDAARRALFESLIKDIPEEQRITFEEFESQRPKEREDRERLVQRG